MQSSARFNRLMSRIEERQNSEKTAEKVDQSDLDDVVDQVFTQFLGGEKDKRLF